MHKILARIHMFATQTYISKCKYVLNTRIHKRMHIGIAAPLCDTRVLPMSNNGGRGLAFFGWIPA
jgi:hypothetical protein